jgi:cytidylate kinase
MKTNPIITFAGDLGSGKSTTAKMVAKLLGFRHESSGDYARSLATANHKSILQAGLDAEKDPNSNFDDQIDQWIRDQGKEGNLVIDSRLASHWLPNSFKIFLSVDHEEGKRRMFESLKNDDNRQKSEDAQTPEEMGQKRIARYESDTRRYKKKYGIDYEDLSGYDLRIDTTNIDKIDVVDQIIAAYDKWLKGDVEQSHLTEYKSDENK